MVRRLFAGEHLRDELAPYAAAMQKVAAEKKVPLVNLHDSSKELVEKLGDEKSMEFANTPTDRTHFNEKGAKAMAELVMQELPAAEPSLKGYLK
jgi:lysophospholipase L1-like esterase